MSDYSFVEAFAIEANKPLDDWDKAGGAAGGGDEFFKQLGELARKIQAGFSSRRLKRVEKPKDRRFEEAQHSERIEP